MRAVDAYDDASPVCRSCQVAPAARTKAATVTRSTAATAPPGRRHDTTGAVGSGDLEARERRAKRLAWEQLAELHGEEFAELLLVARRAEGLRT